ncbi:hypothetical protein GCM10020331_089310 [Ectobacillus funiculus]
MLLKQQASVSIRCFLQEPAGLKMALGENPKRVHSHGNKESITRMGIMGMLREAFYEAKTTEMKPISVCFLLLKH